VISVIVLQVQTNRHDRLMPMTSKPQTCSPSKVALVCPSVCPSDWDKRKTLVARDWDATTCGERQKKKRRGQDSNLRYGVTRTSV
jgi:hypothetical protein